jgi:hypothetical protein
MRVFVVTLARFAQNPEELLWGLTLPRTRAPEDIGRRTRFFGDDADLHVEVTDARVHGSVRIALELGHGLFEARGDMFFGTGHDRTEATMPSSMPPRATRECPRT